MRKTACSCPPSAQGGHPRSRKSFMQGLSHRRCTTGPPPISRIEALRSRIHNDNHMFPSYDSFTVFALLPICYLAPRV